MTQDELKLVLEALKWCHGGEPCGTAEAIAVVEKALAQPEQEPVGMVKDLFTNAAWDKLDVRGSTKVYLDTPPQRTWVGLTGKDWNRSKHNYDFQKGVDWAEAKLKEKNT